MKPKVNLQGAIEQYYSEYIYDVLRKENPEFRRLSLDMQGQLCSDLGKGIARVMVEKLIHKI